MAVKDARLEIKFEAYFKRPSEISVFTFGSAKPSEIETTVVELKIDLLDGISMKISANVVPTIMGGVQRAPLKFDQTNPLVKNFVFADRLLKRVGTGID